MTSEIYAGCGGEAVSTLSVTINIHAKNGSYLVGASEISE
jgi:hypothetical protein